MTLIKFKKYTLILTSVFSGQSNFDYPQQKYNRDFQEKHSYYLRALNKVLKSSQNRSDNGDFNLFDKLFESDEELFSGFADPANHYPLFRTMYALWKTKSINDTTLKMILVSAFNKLSEKQKNSFIWSTFEYFTILPRCIDYKKFYFEDYPLLDTLYTFFNNRVNDMCLTTSHRFENKKWELYSMQNCNYNDLKIGPNPNSLQITFYLVNQYTKDILCDKDKLLQYIQNDIKNLNMEYYKHTNEMCLNTGYTKYLYYCILTIAAKGMKKEINYYFKILELMHDIWNHMKNLHKEQWCMDFHKIRSIENTHRHILQLTGNEHIVAQFNINLILDFLIRYHHSSTVSEIKVNQTKDYIQQNLNDNSGFIHFITQKAYEDLNSILKSVIRSKTVFTSELSYYEKKGFLLFYQGLLSIYSRHNTGDTEENPDKGVDDELSEAVVSF